MKAKSIRTAMAVALTVAAIAASSAGAGGTAVPNQAAGRMDAPVAGARVGFALTMEPQTYRLDFGGGKTISGTLAAREWRLEELSPCERMRPPQPCGECPSRVSPVPPVPLVPPVP